MYISVHAQLIEVVDADIDRNWPKIYGYPSGT
jgi:hypothetical protein